MGRFSARIKKLLGSKKKGDGAGSSSPRLVEQTPYASRTSSSSSSFRPTKMQLDEKKGQNGSRDNNTNRFKNKATDVKIVEGGVTTEEAPGTNDSPVSDTIVRDDKDGKPDLWADAYHQLEKREPALAADYLKHINTFYGNETSNSKSLVLQGPDADSLIDRLLGARQRKQWSIPLLDKDINIRNSVESLTKFCLFFDDIVKSALCCQPCAALAWSGVSILLPLISSGHIQHASMLDGFDYIGKIQIYWRLYESDDVMRDEPRHHDIRKGLTELYSHVVEYQARVVCHLSSSQLSRSWQKLSDSNSWEVKKGSIEKMHKVCSDLLSQSNRIKIGMQRDAQLREMEESRAILSDIRELLQDADIKAEERHTDEKQGALLQDLASDYEHFKSIHPKRVKGTCEWLFNDENFRKWRASNSSSLLWISAGRGCGKSVLARALIDENLLSNNATTSTVCSFFFQTAMDSQTDSASALSALLHQFFLAHPTGDMIQLGLASHKNFGEKLRGNFAELWRLLLSCAEAYSPGELIIVLDALDECGKESRERFLQALDTFFNTSAQNSRIKFLITSRPYDDLEMAFRKHAKRSTYLRVDADEKAVEIEKEINLVIDSKVEDFAQYFSEAHREALSERLKTMENRTYLWLHLTFNVIEERRAFFSKPSSIQKLRDIIPSGVSKAYEETLSRVSANEDDRAQTHALLEIVLAAARPLTLDEANYALTLRVSSAAECASQEGIEEQLWPRADFKAVVRALSGLFITVCDSRLTFIHLTAREFLTDQQKSGQWQGRLSMEDSHGTMALACIDYLTAVDPGRLEGQWDSLAESYPFLPYSMMNWSVHYNSQGKNGQHKLCEKSRRLCAAADGKAVRLMHLYCQAGAFDSAFNDERSCELHLASALGLEPVVASVLKELDLTSEAFVEDYRFAVVEAAYQGHPDVVLTLMKSAENLKGRGEIHGVALGTTAMRVDGSDDRKAAVLRVLLDNENDIHILDPQVTVAAMGMGSREMVSLLLERLGDEIELSEDVLATAAANFVHGDKVMELLLDKRGGEFSINEFVLRAAAGNFGLSRQVMALLMKRRRDEFCLTDSVLREVAGNETTDLLVFLLERCPMEVRITEDFLKAVCGNRDSGLEMMRILWQRKGNEVVVTEKVINAAVGNNKLGLQLLRFLMELVDRNALFTTATLEVAAGNIGCGGRIMEELFDRTGTRIRLNDAVLDSAARNDYDGDKVWECLLRRRGAEIVIKEGLVEAATDNGKCGGKILEMMLNFDKCAPITARAVENAAGNRWSGKAIIELLLQQRGKDITVSARAREEAASNSCCGAEILSMLESAGF